MVIGDVTTQIRTFFLFFLKDWLLNIYQHALAQVPTLMCGKDGRLD